MKRLEAVTGHTRLARRGAVYYHRAAIPQDIKATYPKTEETFSLKTKGYPEALRRVRRAAVEVDERFARHRQAIAFEQADILDDLTPAQLAAAKDAYYRHLPEEDEDLRLSGFLELDEAGQVVGDLPEYPVPTFEEHGDAAGEWADATRYQYARGKFDVFWSSEVDEVLSWGGLSLRLSSSSPARVRLVRALQEAAIAASKALQRRQQGDVIPTPEAPPAPGPAAPLLSEKVREWVAEKSRSNWSEKAQDDHKHWLGVFGEIVGDKPVTEYGKADGLRFKAVLMKMPPNASKTKALRGLSPTAAAEKAAELGIPPMSITNYNKAMLRVGSFFRWAEPNTAGTVVNPVNGLRLKDDVHAKDKRDPLSSAQLTALFSSPVWRSCRSARFCAQPGGTTMAGHWKFWLPLLSLWSGAWSNEIGQLVLSDIKHEDGVDFLRVIDDTAEKRVKTAWARRKVPIHAELKELGFLSFVDDRRRTCGPADRLFPDLKAAASDTIRIP